MQWAFFVDANLEPEVATILDNEGYRAEYSDHVLDADADDEESLRKRSSTRQLVQSALSATDW